MPLINDYYDPIEMFFCQNYTSREKFSLYYPPMNGMHLSESQKELGILRGLHDCYF